MPRLQMLWRYDLPRQSLKALLLGVVVAVVCGLIVTFFYRAPSGWVEDAVGLGEAEGRALGARQGRSAARSEARAAADREFERLLVEGAFGEGRALGFAVAWNDAVARAVEDASHDPTLQLRRMHHWQALLLDEPLTVGSRQ